MKLVHAGTALAFALLTGACAGDDVDTADTTTIAPPIGTTTPAPMPAGTLAFTAVGASTLTGDVGVEGDEGRTGVNVTIRNSVDGVTHKGHVHGGGSCDPLGAVVVPLDDVKIGSNREGTSRTTLQLPMNTVMNGQHVVAFHEAGGNPGAPVLCVAVPAHGAM